MGWDFDKVMFDQLILDCNTEFITLGHIKVETILLPK